MEPTTWQALSAMLLVERSGFGLNELLGGTELKVPPAYCPHPCLCGCRTIATLAAIIEGNLQLFGPLSVEDDQHAIFVFGAVECQIPIQCRVHEFVANPVRKVAS